MHQELEWLAVTPPPTTLKVAGITNLFLSPLTLTAIYFAYSNVLKNKADEAAIITFILLLIIIFANVGALTYVAVLIRSKKNEPIYKCKIDDTNLYNNAAKIPLSSLDRASLSTYVSQNELPYESWEKTTLPGNKPFLSEMLPSQAGSFKLCFSRQLDRQKLIRSFKEYLSSG